ncbi:twin-arginine translocase subunit TatC [Saccharolobus caldissimus]|uniref:Sec-independent protein translocase protein TatC n=1 Tax=Saccharolobus caldissimus TaxID=1702097 RepID=A0AAQ4CTM2_9CREN|nr:twin-arginine translocase subunit TatC [Saccharolobus caldissimus]BDB99153.1 twin-arginine translocase subunit TatC [Saccharolobus caldissimus]
MIEKSREKAKEEFFQEKPLLEHIRELAIRLRRIIIALAISFLFYFMIGYEWIKTNLNIKLLGASISISRVPVPYPSFYDSIAVKVTRFMIYHEIPKGVKIIIINLFDPLFASLYVSLYLAILTTLPIIIKETWAFLSPGLYESEKKIFKLTIIPAFLLFIAGSSFAFFLLIPLMFDLILLYTYSLGPSVEPTISLNSFISTVFLLMASLGLAFEMPLIMVGLTYLGIVKASTWRNYWRWGVLISFIIAWIISPGTTGGVMETIIGLSLSSLYFVGMGVSYMIEKKRN